ncbi:MAG: beta-lactamase family protein [Cyclobacteriaceae bacterium]|nr:beta-lactamase family protein [Cyclobacteriaceae bacterium]
MTRKKVIAAILFLIIISVAFLLQLPSPPITPKKKVVVHELKARESLKAVPVNNPFLKELLIAYEAEIEALIASSKTPGAAIAIVQDTSIIYLKGFGIKAIGTQDSVDTETVFRLASVSKCFAPVLTGMLVEDNVLKWDDKVITHLPDFALKSREQTEQLTLRHVLSHTVGLPYHTYTNLIEDGEDLHTMLTKLRDVEIIGKVGKVYSYQNVAYSIIAEVIQSATGKSYEQLMMERIFNPLHMTHASISYDAIMQNTNVAKPHQHTRKSMALTTISNTYYNVAPAGGINASVSDMAQWIKAMLGNREDVIAHVTLDEIFTPVVKAPAKNRNFRKWSRPTGSFYAMGWRMLNFKTDTLYYHGGYVNGYRSELAVDRKNKIGICVLTNATGALADNSIPYFFNLYMKHGEAIREWDLQNRTVTTQSKVIATARK